MWRPTTEAAILAAIDRFVETDILEAKEVIPSKGIDIASRWRRWRPTAARSSTA